MLDAQPAGGGDPVEHRHVQVHQDDVGAQRGDPVQRRGAVAGLPDDLDLGAHLQQRGQRLAEQRLVVDEQHPHRRPSTVIRAPHAQRRPRTGRRLDVDAAAEPVGPLAQPEQPEARRRARRRSPAAVVADLQPHGAVVAVVQHQAARGRPRRACARWSGPPARPGTAPPRPSAGSGRTVPVTSSSVGTPAADASSASACSAVGQRRRGRASRSAATDRRTSASASVGLLLRLGQHGVGPGRIGGEHRPRGLDLHLDDGEVVAQAVVDVAGEPVALLRGGQLLGLGGVLAQPRRWPRRARPGPAARAAAAR